MARPNVVTLTTDFGLVDHYAGALKGVLLDVFPDVRIADITHAIQAYDVLDGALAISESYKYFPTGSVHMVVVDPGVGSERRPILASAGEHYFVAPDNGVLSLVYAQAESVVVREITSSHYFRQPTSSTFHGRDVFAPVAANLAKGVDPAKFGDEITDYVRFAAPRPRTAADGSLQGTVLKVDRYGNLITNIRAADAPQLLGDDPLPFRIVIGKTEITEIFSHYAQGAPGEAFAILGSMGFLEISVNRGTAAKVLGIVKGSEVAIRMGSAAAAGS